MNIPYTWNEMYKKIKRGKHKHSQLFGAVGILIFVIQLLCC